MAVKEEEKTTLLLTHLSGIIFSFIVPLVVYFVKQDGSEEFNTSIKESLNFQLTIFIISFVCSITAILVIPIILAVIAGFANLILCIMAAIAIREGKDYRYPFAIRMVK